MKAPQNVRPFWISASCTGLSGGVSCGPKALDGELDATVKIRQEGKVSGLVLKIEGRNDEDGNLILRAWVNDGSVGNRPVSSFGAIELRTKRDA